MSRSIVGLDSAVKEAEAGPPRNMLISSTLVVDLKNRISELESKQTPKQTILDAIEACKATPGAEWVSVHALTEYANRIDHDN